MIPISIYNETATLESVILGTAHSMGGVPSLQDVYDPKSRSHIINGTYPKEVDMIQEMTAFETVLIKHGVRVYRPDILKKCNQIFTRDIGFVIENYFFKSNILPIRAPELKAIEYILQQIDSNQIVEFEPHVHVEGGDVILHNDYIFMGIYQGADYPEIITARTNIAAVKSLQNFFPNKKVVPFDLNKSVLEAHNNALHLDCCFQPVGSQYAIIHPEGFTSEDQLQWLIDFFGTENIHFITKDEMYHMNSNVFSISPTVVVSDPSFDRLNNWLRSKKITVEEVSYTEISKQEGLFRCSTLPLKRNSK